MGGCRSHQVKRHVLSLVNTASANIILRRLPLEARGFRELLKGHSELSYKWLKTKKDTVAPVPEHLVAPRDITASAAASVRVRASQLEPDPSLTERQQAKRKQDQAAFIVHESRFGSVWMWGAAPSRGDRMTELRGVGRDSSPARRFKRSSARWQGSFARGEGGFIKTGERNDNCHKTTDLWDRPGHH